MTRSSRVFQIVKCIWFFGFMDRVAISRTELLLVAKLPDLVELFRLTNISAYLEVLKGIWKYLKVKGLLTLVGLAGKSENITNPLTH